MRNLTATEVIKTQIKKLEESFWGFCIVPIPEKQQMRKAAENPFSKIIGKNFQILGKNGDNHDPEDQRTPTSIDQSKSSLGILRILSKKRKT